jgi:hypothetical protein
MKAGMRRFVLGLLLVLAPAVVCPPADAAKPRPRATAIGYTRDAARVLSQARAASGGAGWNFLRGWHETGKLGGAAYETWQDPLRYGLRVEVRAPDGLHVRGFNGQGAWTIAPSGEARGTGDPGPVGLARAEAFFGVYGFFYPGRFDAHGDYLGVRQLSGRAFDVVEVKPWNGPGRQLWFDRRTHLIARMVETGGSAPLTYEFSDWRKVGPVRVAFRIESPGDPALTRQLESLSFVPADRGLFSLPRQPGG